MAYKFEQLDVWQRALEYIDRIHEIAEQLPKREQYNLAEQMTRAANSFVLNLKLSSRWTTGAFRSLHVRSVHFGLTQNGRKGQGCEQIG